MTDIVDTTTLFSATHMLFREDSYRTEAEARSLGAHGDMLVLDQTLFYAASGGQPADHGEIRLQSGQTVAVTEVRYLDPGKTRIGHVLPPGLAAGLKGQPVSLRLDWIRRERLMRIHTALHLLSVVLPYPVTGGAVNVDDGRLDFDIPDAGLDRQAIEDELNRLIATDAAVTDRWIAEEELDRNPSLVKTLSVQPPRGTGTIRLVEIAGSAAKPLDLQPCGGTHVRRTGEIGRMVVTNIEKKGKINRRVRIGFA
jgi:misacylated tRNA(Ala) deacylase